MNKGCGESLRGVDPSMIHRVRCKPIFKDCGEFLKRVDPSMIHCTGYTPICKGSSET